MTTPQANAIPLLNFTLAAALKVKSLIDEEGNPRLNLRVYITGGGCSGFQYGFTFDEAINDDDIVIERDLTAKEPGDANMKADSVKLLNDLVSYPNDSLVDEDEDDEGGGDGGAGAVSVKLLVDPMSFQYLQGAEIDYREDVNGSQFVIRNPNAKTTCGCGSSFSA